MTSHPRSVSRPYRVMIVDDVPAVRESLRWLLQDEGDFLVVGEASDGLEALRCAEQFAPEIVILDIELPLLDGYGVARQLKTLPRAPGIVFLSVHDDDCVRQQCLDAGGDTFVTKNQGWMPLIAGVRQAVAP